MMRQTDLETAVRQSGRSMSRQRAAILAALRSTTSHPTALELYDMVRPRMRNLTLATVYRNLKVLAELGLARELDAGDAARRYDADTHTHCHIRCTACGRVDDVEVRLPARVVEQAEAATGYALAGWQVVFAGVCRSCQEGQGALPIAP